MAYEQEISERRRRRRAEERRRRAAARRRRALMATAALAAGVGAIVGAGASEPSPAGSVIATASADEDSNCAAPAASEPAAASRSDQEVPVLMYHNIDTPPEGAALPELFVAPEDFAAQIDWLQQQGYTAITLDQLDDGWRGRAALPDEPIVISFDDGYRGQYTNALPVLVEAGWPAELNLGVGNVTNGELTRDMVCEMLTAGWELGGHTFTHPDLTTMDGSTLEHEVAGSRKWLQRRFGAPVRHFAYPVGDYNEVTIAAVEAAGYSGALTTATGLASPAAPFEQPRIRIDRSDGVTGLISKLGGP